MIKILTSRSLPPSPARVRNRRTVTIGNVKLGSDHPIVRQTMTTSDTRDVEATVAEVRAEPPSPRSRRFFVFNIYFAPLSSRPGASLDATRASLDARARGVRRVEGF